MANKSRLFLGGGGSEEDSRPLDERFVALIDRTRPLVYIPHAMPRNRHPSCLSWFTSAMNSLGIFQIMMLKDLASFSRARLASISGVYMGGGDTARLLGSIRETNFSEVLLAAIDSGIPIYGGSAGAIVLGADIRTAPEASRLTAARARGLNVVAGHSIACHYTKREQKRLERISKALRMNILAVPETSGLCVLNGKIENCGKETVAIFKRGTVEPPLLPGRDLKRVFR